MKATTALRWSAWSSAGFSRSRSYQRVVNPASGNEVSPSLKEKIASSTIGRYRKTTRKAKNNRSRRRPPFEVAISISSPPS